MYSDPCYKLLDNVHFLLTNVSVEIKFICPNGYIKKKNADFVAFVLHGERLEQMDV